ncbi:MAG: cupin domain-containing protein [archaeon]|nr:cupin domain-containing protein [archaeon]
MEMMKNIAYCKAQDLADMVEYSEGKVVSLTLSQNPNMNVTLFAFAKGEGLSTHKSDGDAFVQVLAGKGKFTIDGVEHIVEKGECIVMPAGHPHAVDAVKKFKMLLTVIFPPE